MADRQSTNVWDYLTVKPLVTYPKGQRVYTGVPTSLYLVIAGRVKVSRGPEVRKSVIKIVGANGLFGESCLIAGGLGEEVTALTETRVMAWTPHEIERMIENSPRLGVALLREVAGHLLSLQERVEVGANCAMRDRMMFTLVQLAHSSAVEVEGDRVRLPALNHGTLAGHVGTSRGIVTTHMGRLQKLGLVKYSRQHIDVDCIGIEKALSSHGVRIRHRGRDGEEPVRSLAG